jgi:hypothetical protein
LPRAACRLTVGGLAYEDRVDADLAAYNVPLLTVAAAARSAARASITDMQNGDASVPIDPEDFDSVFKVVPLMVSPLEVLCAGEETIP